MNLLSSFNSLCKNNASFDYITFLNVCNTILLLGRGVGRVAEYISLTSLFPVF